MVKQAFSSCITVFLQEQAINRKKVTCEVGDLVKGKILFKSPEHLRKALAIIDQICYSREHQILRMTNKLCDLQQEVILNIRVKGIVCELKLSLKQDETLMKFIQSLEQLRLSPLGCIFGSCLLLCKEVNYPLLRNCQDIVNILIKRDREDKTVLENAMYVIQSLNECQLLCK